MCTSSTAVAARTARSPPAGPAHRSTKRGRRRFPPAANVAPASPASVAPCPAVSSPRRRSTAAIPAGSHLPASSSTEVTGGGTVDGRGTVDSPLTDLSSRTRWLLLYRAMYAAAHAAVDRDDAAGQKRPADPLQPGSVHHGGQPFGRGEALHGLRKVGVGVAITRQGAESRHDSVEPQAMKPGERGAARLCDLEDHEAPSLLEGSGHLVHAPLEVGEVPHPEAGRHGVEAGVLVREVEGVGPLEGHLGHPQASRLLSRQL